MTADLRRWGNFLFLPFFSGRANDVTQGQIKENSTRMFQKIEERKMPCQRKKRAFHYIALREPPKETGPDLGPVDLSILNDVPKRMRSPVFPYGKVILYCRGPSL